MKIAYVTPFYNVGCDGRFGRFLDWVHELRDTENKPFQAEVHAFTTTGTDSLLVSRPRSTLGSADQLWATNLTTPEELLNFRRLISDIKNSNADIIHLIAPNPIAIAAVRLGAGDRPTVLGPNIGGWFPLRPACLWETDRKSWVKNRLRFVARQRFISLSKYAHVVAFSEYHARMLKQAGVSRDEMTVVQPGISSLFSPSASLSIGNPPELLYVGDLNNRKGYRPFLKALSKIDHPLRATVIGAGPVADDLLDSLAIRELVTHKGYVPREELPNYYKRADLFVVPSVDETAGTNTQFEALACGTPVIATDAPGLNEFADDTIRVLSPSRSSGDLAGALTEAIQRLPELTANARERSSEFSASSTLEQLRIMYSMVQE